MDGVFLLKGAQPESMNGYDIWVIELIVPAKQALMLQAWLLAEDGLAVIRCRDPEKKKQQLWTTVNQLEEAHAWLKSLPVTVEVNAEWLWSENDE